MTTIVDSEILDGLRRCCRQRARDAPFRLAPIDVDLLRVGPAHFSAAVEPLVERVAKRIAADEAIRQRVGGEISAHTAAEAARRELGSIDVPQRIRMLGGRGLLEVERDHYRLSPAGRWVAENYSDDELLSGHFDFEQVLRGLDPTYTGPREPPPPRPNKAEILRILFVGTSEQRALLWANHSEHLVALFGGQQ